MNLTLTELFADSTHLNGLCSTITADTELQEILLQAQGTVNAFIKDVGQFMRSETLIADTFMLFGEAYSTQVVKYFTVAAVIHDSSTGKQRHLFFPFAIILAQEEGQLPPGLYYLYDNAA